MKKQKNFWKSLKKPFFALAPMADVTDVAFRRIIAKHGKPDVFWTEFVSADGLCSPGREVLLRDLGFTRAERPIVAQLFSSRLDKMREAAALCAELGFDGIDINMGCPDRSIEKQGSGAAMIRTPKKAREIIRAAKEGAPGLPVSVKTRIGYSKDEIATWVPELLAENIAALTMHCRTRKEMSNVPARWEHMREVVHLRDALAPETLVIGNGDVRNIADARAKTAEYGVDGVMLGRAIFGNPWLFSEKTPSISEKLLVMVEHTKLFEKLLGDIKSFAIMKKHYKAYVNGFDGAKELRADLMNARDAKEVGKIVRAFLKSRPDIK
ncbi:MAG: tRNA-dihydrouridine synthase [Patescibacteria group bacterium]|nr:tRNA-dihydrouridine synthase [Patescibacteria group bacterium]MDE2116532.1 tRNA-dihydrouridine synthase [Patescibacteria group bacterium]